MFHLCSEAMHRPAVYFRTPGPVSLQRGSEGCLVSAPGAEIKLIYCTSIRQRELHSCCQLIVLSLITDSTHVRRAYTPILPAVKTKIAPMCKIGHKITHFF